MIRLREDAGNARRMPGSRWLVKYQDDPDWWHERVFACPITTNRWVVWTADGDQNDEAFGNYEKMVPWTTVADARTVSCRNAMRFSRGLTRDEMRECVQDGRAEAERIRAADRLVAPQEPVGSRRGRPGLRLAWRSLASALRKASCPASVAHAAGLSDACVSRRV